MEKPKTISEKKFCENFAKEWEETRLTVKRNFGEKLKNMQIVAYNCKGRKVK